MTLTTGGARRPRMPTPSVGERKGARAMMTPKERLQVHARIERQNRAHFDAWKQGRQLKRKPNVRHIVAVRGERGRVA